MALTGKPSLTTAAPVTNDGFWPDLMLGDLMDKYRIPPEYADQVIISGLVMSIIRVNDQLESVKTALKDLGFTSLLDYSQSNTRLINGEELLITEYQNAIFCRAKAGLLQQFNSLNRKPVAENDAKESGDNEQYWMDLSQASIAVFYKEVLPDVTVLTKAGVTVELMS